MENNFFNYITKQLQKDEVDIWLKTNNIIPEKMELYYDFCNSLYLKITETYLGDSNDSETKITMTNEDKLNHFNWCWGKVLDDFKKEEILFEKDGDHYEYFKIFYDEIFYKQDDTKIRNSIDVFFRDVFDFEKSFTRSDLDMILEIYKNLDKNLLV
jgi:hypothetical protein